MFIIKSASSSSRIRFRDHDRDYFTVELETFPVTARARISSFTVGNGLAHWFAELAACRKPWEGSREWASMESDFIISATCSLSGTVGFTIELSGLPGSYEEWRVSAGLTSELGILPGIAEAAQGFFGGGTTHRSAGPAR